MKSRTRMVGLGALAIACAPVVASATVLFQDNFDAGTSGTRYDQFIFDRANQNDASANFNFNYGAFKYWHVNADESIQNVGEFIPLAPHSAAGSPAVGLRLDVNNDGSAPSPNTAVIDLYPKLAQYLGGTLPSGDHKMTVDVFIDYNGRIEGGGGSTEHLSVGLNQQGGGIGGGTPVAPPGGPFNGLGWTINGERGNAFDYRYWRANTRIGGTDALDPLVGQIAQDEGPGLPGPADGRNQFYQQAFPMTNPSDPNEVWYETQGAIGKHWTTLTMVYEDGIIYHYLQPAGSANPPILIAARTEEGINSGHVMLGYVDLNNGTAQLENGDGSLGTGGFGDANFVVYDNLVVETISQTRQKWNFSGGGAWTESAKWDNGVPNAVTHVADFTTPLTAPATVNVTAGQTVRSIVFDSAANGYTLANAGGSINFDALTTGIIATIKVKSGSHTIAAPITSTRDLSFQVATGSALNITGDMSIAGRNLEKTGAGSATVKNLRANNITVSAGTLAMAPDTSANGTSNIAALTIATAAKLDLKSNKLITTTAAGTVTGGIYNGVQGEVQRAYDFGAWDGNGMTTSMPDAVAGLTTIGIATGEQVRGLGATDTDTFSGQVINGASVIAMYTYAGDANLDGTIDGGDYGIIDNFVQVPGAAGYANGDFNYDGVIDGGDYGIIDNNIQAQGAPFDTSGGVSLSGVSAVPEPSACAFAIVAGAGLLARRRRQS